MAHLRFQNNFGIAAGKTTTTEHILRYTGMIYKIGQVYEDAVTNCNTASRLEDDATTAKIFYTETILLFLLK